MPADPVLPHNHTPNTPSLYTTTCQFPSNLLTPHIYNPTVPSLKWKEMYLWQYKPILYKVLQSIIQYYLLCAETNKRFYYYYYYYYYYYNHKGTEAQFAAITKALRPSLLQPQRHWGPVCCNSKDTEAQFAATTKTLMPSLLQRQRLLQPLDVKGCVWLPREISLPPDHYHTVALLRIYSS